MLYLNISFDYELFMGENYVSEKEVLIDPTYKIASMLKEEGVAGTFFADVCCPIRYRQLGETVFPDLFDKQLQDLTEMAQDVQLHIHPNWLKATSVGEKVEFDRASYRIHNWADGDDLSAAKNIIHTGIDYLNQLIKPINPGYKCIAYRAGGFCLQPEKEIAPLLYDAGIRIDSSVCHGLKCTTGGMYYDYTTLPKTRNIWFNSENSLADSCTFPVSDGIFEVPVGTYSRFPYRPIASKLNKGIPGYAKNGQAMSLPEVEKTSFKKGLFRRIKRILTASNYLSFDFYNSTAMLYMINRIVKDESCRNKDVYITTIAHPKFLSDARFESIYLTVKSLKNHPYIQFVTMQDIAKKINVI